MAKTVIASEALQVVSSLVIAGYAIASLCRGNTSAELVVIAADGLLRAVGLIAKLCS